MTESNDKFKQFLALMGALREEKITKEQFAHLNKLLAEDQHIRKSYVFYIRMCAELRSRPMTPGIIEHPVMQAVLKSPDIALEPNLENALWKALLENEKHAAGVELPPSDETDNHVTLPATYSRNSNNRHKISRLSLYTAICSTAALLMLIVYVFTHPVPQQPPVVAALVNSHNAVWFDYETIADGSQLHAGLLTLQKGLAKITFLDGAEVIIEGPSDIELENAGQMMLLSGTITANVPKNAIGFVVRTPTATIVDYGTEFGVMVANTGSSEAHVFKGSVQLRTGSNPVRFGRFKNLTTGMAGTVDEYGNISAEKLKAQPHRFARRLPATQKPNPDLKIDLGPREKISIVDLICGGDGFGRAQPGQSIDPVTGELMMGFENLVRDSSTKYQTVDSLDCVDGVFVPDGKLGPVQISSKGHKFERFPRTDGKLWGNIAANEPLNYKDNEPYFPSLIGQEYGTASHPGIIMHANSGITFDLQAIRSLSPSIKIVAFSALCGIDETALEEARADFWVLVDGKLQFKKPGLTAESEPVNVDVPLSENNQFLTLAVTDGGNMHMYDWMIIAAPVIEYVQINSNNDANINNR